MATLDMKNQHADLLFVGKTSVKPAPRGRPIIRYLLIGSLALTTAAWTIAKIVDIQRVSVAKEEIEERKNEAALKSLSQARDQLVGQLDKLSGQIEAANADIVARVPTNEAYAYLAKTFPSPVVKIPYDLHSAAKADEASWVKGAGAPTLDAEYARVSALLNTQAKWVNDVNNAARSMRYGQEVPAWFVERWGYLTPPEPVKEVPVAQVVPAPVTAPAPAQSNYGAPEAPRYEPAPEQVEVAEAVQEVPPVAAVPAPAPAPVVKPAPKPPAPAQRASDGRTEVENWFDR